MHTGTEQAERSGANECPPYVNLSTNMNVNIELQNAPALHKHKYEHEREHWTP